MATYTETHDGVLLPADMRAAPTKAKDAYAARVKRGNRAFVDAALELEDRADALGIDLDRG